MEISEISFSLKSMMDDFGRVFFYDGKVFRAINNDKKKYCLELINSDLFKELLQFDLIPKTKIADVKIDGFELILEHEKLTESLQHEWSFKMLKSAAETVLKVNSICNKFGYELKDAHSLNILFRGTKPLWVDIGSIALKTDSPYNWVAYDEFVGSFFVPLIFWSEGNILIARKLLESNFHRIDLLPAQDLINSDLLSLLNQNVTEFKFNFLKVRLFSTNGKIRFIAWVTAVKNKFLNIITSRKDVHFLNYYPQFIPLNRATEILESIDAPLLESSWQDYHKHYYTNNGEEVMSSRFKRIIELIIEHKSSINSVLDLAGNQGLLCDLIRKNAGIKKITLTDYDANALDFAFEKFRQNNIENIDMLLLNFMFTPDIRGTAKRIKSDLVMALAVTHHLVLTAGYSLDAILERLKLYTNRYVMVEFMPLGLWAIGSKDFPELPLWYNIDWFRNKFQNNFNLLHEEKLEDNRILFFGEIIS